MAKTNKMAEPPKNKIYLNGVEVKEIPKEALAIMSERLSRVVSAYFSEHPDEYERFLAERERKRAASDAT